MDKLPCSVDFNQTFLSHPILAQWAHEQVAMVSGMEVMHGLSNMVFYSLKLICLQSPLSAQPEPNSELLIWHHSPGG